MDEYCVMNRPSINPRQPSAAAAWTLIHKQGLDARTAASRLGISKPALFELLEEARTRQKLSAVPQAPFLPSRR
jgi:DNA-binding transcriptional regulator LsrR (DeoR family)